MCHGAAIAKNTSVLETSRSLRMCRKFLVMSKYKKTAPSGNTRPIRLLVSTFSAQVAANPQQTQRDGGSCSSDSRKKKAVNASQRPTMISGIWNLVKIYGPRHV